MDKVKRHMDICEKLNEIYKNKNSDYGDSFGETFKKLGIISAVTRITDKVNRLQRLCTGEQKVNDESILDTLDDLANYAVMTRIEIENMSGAEEITLSKYETVGHNDMPVYKKPFDSDSFFKNAEAIARGNKEKIKSDNK